MPNSLIAQHRHLPQQHHHHHKSQHHPQQQPQEERPSMGGGFDKTDGIKCSQSPSIITTTTTATTDTTNTTTTSSSIISENGNADFYKKREQRRLQRYNTYDTCGDDDDDDDTDNHNNDDDHDNDVVSNTSNGCIESNHKRKSDGEPDNLIEKWERNGALQEVVGSQSILTQELTRYSSIGSMNGSALGDGKVGNTIGEGDVHGSENIIDCKLRTDKKDDSEQGSLHQREMDVGTTITATVKSASSIHLSKETSVTPNNGLEENDSDGDNNSQVTLVDDAIGIDVCEEEEEENTEYPSKELTTNDILNNRILASQIEEEEEEVENLNKNQTAETTTSTLSPRTIFAQRQNSMSLSNFAELSQVSLPFSSSQISMTMTDLLGAAQEIAKRDGEEEGGATVKICASEKKEVNNGVAKSNKEVEGTPEIKKEEISDSEDSRKKKETIGKASEEEEGIGTISKTGDGSVDVLVKHDALQFTEQQNMCNVRGSPDMERKLAMNNSTIPNNHSLPIKEESNSNFIAKNDDTSLLHILAPGPELLSGSVSASGAVLASAPAKLSSAPLPASGLILPSASALQSTTKPTVTSPKMLAPTSHTAPCASSSTPSPPTGSTDTKKRPGPPPPLPLPPPAQRLARKTKLEREAEKAETNNIAKRAAELVSQFRGDKSVEKQLLLSMALTRENPRSSPSDFPKRGTSIYNGFYWGQYPPLEKVLRSHMEEYYELSIKKCQSRAQQAFNNKLVDLVKGEAEQFGWTFHKLDFDEKRIRDRIRCFFKTHIQNAKKRLKTMVRNPTKKANAKALVAHIDLINKHRRSSTNNTSNNKSNENDLICQTRSSPQENNRDNTKNVTTEKDDDARDAANVLVLGFGRKK